MLTESDLAGMIEDINPSCSSKLNYDCYSWIWLASCGLRKVTISSNYI